jgi:predicted ATPase
MGSILGAAPLNTLVDDIMARTDGVPLFVEEVTWEVLERKGAGDAETATIPATLQGSLMAQLDRLPGAARNVALIASVIGREFGDELLIKATGLDDTALAEALGHLGRAQLVVPSGAARGAHMFRHALIQDVAYQALLNRTRRQHHRRIGEMLIANHSEVAELQPELIARHFSEAGLPEEALPFWTRGRAGVEAVGELRGRQPLRASARNGLGAPGGRGEGATDACSRAPPRARPGSRRPAFRRACSPSRRGRDGARVR